MTLTKILGITAAVAALGLSNVYAEEAAELQKPDVNRDGKISLEEFRAVGEKRMEKHFKRMDANGDGFIDQAEKQAMHEKWGEKHKVGGEYCHKPEAVETH